MATILEFRASARGASAAEHVPGRVIPAKILPFPGVRHERWTEAAQRKAEEKRRRDPLEITD